MKSRYQFFFKSTNLSFANKIGTTILITVSRVINLAPNFSPLGSFGFFQKNLLLFFGQIIIFDYLISGLYPGFIFSYLGFASYYILGRLAHNNLKKQVCFLPLAALFFFLLSNFGVWLYWYPRTWTGLLTCYSLALPFFRNTLLGDVFFGGIVVGWRAFFDSAFFRQFSIFKNYQSHQVYAQR